MSGRFFAMDRDNRWDRIGLAYKAIIEGSLKKILIQLKQLKIVIEKILLMNFLNL